MSKCAFCNVECLGFGLCSFARFPQWAMTERYPGENFGLQDMQMYLPSRNMDVVGKNIKASSHDDVYHNPAKEMPQYT